MKRKNDKKTFLAIANKYNVCSKDLLDFLELNGLFECPASTTTSMHYAYEGGLVDHIIETTKIALNLLNGIPEPLRPSKESVVKVCFLHDLGKLNLYTPNKSEWHKKNLGKMYEFNEDLVSMTNGERSLWYIYNCGNNDKLTQEEHQAILSFDKNDNSDLMVKWHSESLSRLLRHSLEWAIMLEKKEYKDSTKPNTNE